MEGTHEVGRRPFMPASTLSGRSVALLRANLRDCTTWKADQFHMEIAQEPEKASRSQIELFDEPGFSGDHAKYPARLYAK